MKTRYAILAVLGFLLPMSQLVPFVRASGFDLVAFVRHGFANPAASMFALDLLTSCVVFGTFVSIESRRRGIRHSWVYIVMLLSVGLSFALPMFLLARERAREGALAT